MVNKSSSPIQIISACVGLFLLFSAVALMNTATASESGTRANSISHSPNDVALSSVVSSDSDSATNTEYISPEFTTEFRFNGVGLTWSGPQSADINFAMAVDDGEWQTLAMQGEDAKEAVEYFTSAPLFATGQRLRYRITGPDTNQVRNVRLTYFDSTTAPQRSLLSTISQTIKRSVQTDTPTIISRADWGADDSYLTWQPQYSTPKKIIIHHTAGGNGDDAAATIRGIYYWHAVVLGWGDIGYNYLIDQQGNIYEGRAGGAGVIGAHAYNDNTEINYNVGSVGIALLGCFESTTGACATLSEYSETINTALTDLISTIASSAGFDPSGTKKWHGEKLPNVIGHRDVDSTYCPGDLIYAELAAIRATASSKYTLLQSAYPNQQAQWQSADIAETYSTTDQPTVTLTYANTGATTWQPTNGALQLSIIETGKHQRVALPNPVATSTSATLASALTIMPKHSGTYTLVSKLYRKGNVIPGSTHKYAITVIAAYGASNASLSLPVAIQAGWTPTLNFTAQNSGTQNWAVGTTLTVNGVIVKTLNKAVKPGDQLNLAVAYGAAATLAPGIYTIKVQLQTTTGNTIENSRVLQSLRVD